MIGDIAGSVAYGIGDQLSRGGSSYGSRPGSTYEWDRGYSQPDRPLISSYPNDRPLIQIGSPERGNNGWGGWGGPGNWGGNWGGGNGGWGGWRRDRASDVFESTEPVTVPVQRLAVPVEQEAQVKQDGEQDVKVVNEQS